MVFWYYVIAILSCIVIAICSVDLLDRFKRRTACKCNHSVLKRDVRPRKDAWAPGEYYNHCYICDIQFIGSKYARCCARCAYSSRFMKWLRRQLRRK